MAASAPEDRITTKRTVKQLEFGHGALRTQAIQTLWVTRFNAFWELTLQQSVAQPFCGDDLLRFLDAIIAKITVGTKNKPALNRSLIRTGLYVLKQYGQFTYSPASGFALTSQDAMRIKTFMHDACKAGRLTPGK